MTRTIQQIGVVANALTWLMEKVEEAHMAELPAGVRVAFKDAQIGLMKLDAAILDLRVEELNGKEVSQ